MIHSFAPSCFFFISIAELGDHTKGEHAVETISEFRFLPDHQQTEQFEGQVLEKWATYKYVIFILSHRRFTFFFIHWQKFNTS